MEENKKLKIILVIFILLIIFIAIILAITKETKKSDFTINLSTLPQEQLWTIDHANQMLEKAFHIDFLFVQDEQAMLELVKHAYQWDKNAMIVYAQILEAVKTREPEDNTLSFKDFLKKYSYELVDKQRNILQTPKVFEFSYNDLLKLLADNNYPYPAHVLSLKILFQAGSNNNIFLPLTKENRDLIIYYSRSSIKGGYKDYEILADALLFQTGQGYKDTNLTLLNKLVEHIPNLTNESVKEAVNSFEICAMHGNQYCIVRMIEAYYSGLGVEKNLQMAFVWIEIELIIYNKLKNNSTDILSNNRLELLHNYSIDIRNQLLELLNTNELKEVQILTEQTKQSIQWNYKEWASQREPIPPQP